MVTEEKDASYWKEIDLIDCCILDDVDEVKDWCRPLLSDFRLTGLGKLK